MVLADLTVDGKPTKVLMDANRNGFFYVLDRTNGKLLAANPYVKVNWATGIDMETGRPIETDVTKDAPAAARRSRLSVGPRRQELEPDVVQSADRPGLCQHAEFRLATTSRRAANTSAGDWYLRRRLPICGVAETEPRGYLKAIDPDDRQDQVGGAERHPALRRRAVDRRRRWCSPAQLTGEFEAFDADNGNKLWQFQTGSGIEGQPVTWQQDGVQYVAVVQRHRRRLFAVLRRRAAGERAGRRIVLGLRGKELIADRL